MVSVVDSMLVTKETSCMHEQCVLGAPSDFSRNEAMRPALLGVEPIQDTSPVLCH